MRYRYYLTARPASLGTQPNGFLDYTVFDVRKYCPEINREAWGWVEYDHPLTDKQILSFELTVATEEINSFKQFRQRYGSRNKFAEMTGLSARTIEAWEQGLRNAKTMSVTTFKQMADALGMTMDELYNEF